MGEKTHKEKEIESYMIVLLLLQKNVVLIATMVTAINNVVYVMITGAVACVTGWSVILAVTVSVVPVTTERVYVRQDTMENIAV